MVHAPKRTSVTWFALTVQTVAVLDVNMTPKPDVAVAVKVTGEAASAVVGIGTNVIDCATLVTEKTRVMFGATFHVAFPLCDAVTEHRPTASRLITLPDALQMVGEPTTNVTGSMDVADAVKLTVPADRFAEGGAANVIVCATLAIWNEVVTVLAPANVALPLCVACSVQSPFARSMTVFPLTVQTAGVCVVIVTGRPDEAVALATSDVVMSVC